MKKIVIFGVILAIICSMSVVCSAATGENWVPNGSYDGEGRIPEFGSPNGVKAEGEGIDGTTAWKMLCGPSGTYKSYAWTLQYTCGGKNLEEGKIYTFSFWTKASTEGKIELRSNNFKFKVITDGVEGTETNQIKLDLTTEYKLQTVKFLVSTVTMNGTTQKNSQLTFYLGNKAGYVMSDAETNAYVWVDDVFLAEEIEETPVTVGVKAVGSEAAVEKSYTCGSSDGTIPQITSISAEIASGADSFTDAVFIMAYYNSDGMLKKVASAAVEATASFSEITTEAGGKFKFFIFENGTIKPLADRTEVIVANQ